MSDNIHKQDESRVTELKDALQGKLDRVQDLASTFQIETKDDGEKHVSVTEEQRADYLATMADARQIRGLIEDAQGVSEMKAMLAAVSEEGQVDASVAKLIGGSASASQVEEFKTLGAQFIASDEFKALKESGGLTMQTPFEVKGDLASNWKGYGPAERKDMYTTLPGTFTNLGFGSSQRDPLVPQQQRTARVRDLFPVQQTSANLIEYFRVTGFTNGASVVPERSGGAFGVKPQTTIAFEPLQAPVRTIAHYEVAHRNVLADEPQLRGIIDNELLYGLRLHEDTQILSGTGTGEDLQGILGATDVQTYSGSAGPATDTDADAIRRAMTLAMLAYYEPTGVVMHPTDWEGIELVKDSQDRYIITGSVSVGAAQTLWRLPVVATNAIPVNTALVGSFGLGAQLYDREMANIRVAEQHSDFFVRNAVVILAEERLALAIKRPESFVDVTLD